MRFCLAADLMLVSIKYADVIYTLTKSTTDHQLIVLNILYSGECAPCLLHRFMVMELLHYWEIRQGVVQLSDNTVEV